MAIQVKNAKRHIVPL